MGHHAPRSVEGLVEFQVRKWSTRRITRPSTAVRQSVITISREFGAQGEAVGELVAAQLDFGFWHQAIVHAIAEDAGASEQIIAAVDEHQRNRFSEVLNTFSSTPRVTASDYFERLRHVVSAVGSHGSAVIVGRGANFLVDDPHALRVRVIRPNTSRFAGLAARRGLTRDAARELAHQVDRERARFIKEHYGADVRDPHHYDLIVNLRRADLPTAAKTIVAAYQARVPPHG